MKDIKSQTDESLMSHFANGSHQAFGEIYQRYAQRLLYFMYRMLQQDEALAQDKLHDVFARIVERPSLFDNSRNFKSWIFTVAANECRKHYRVHQTIELDESINLCENELLVFDKMEQSSFRTALYQELSNLSYEHRCVFVLRYQEKLSIKEIGQIMDCPAGTVKSRIYYSIKILSDKLAIYNPLKK